MSNITEFNGEASILRDNEGQHMDAFGHAMLLGAFSDLCRHRDNESDPKRAMQLGTIIKQMGRVLARYEPDGCA